MASYGKHEYWEQRYTRWVMLIHSDLWSNFVSDHPLKSSLRRHNTPIIISRHHDTTYAAMVTPASGSQDTTSSNVSSRQTFYVWHLLLLHSGRFRYKISTSGSRIISDRCFVLKMIVRVSLMRTTNFTIVIVRSLNSRWIFRRGRRQEFWM